MTENEKLRALLAEAREWVKMNGEAGCPADQCEQCAAADEMLQRIDAALAEGSMLEWDDHPYSITSFDEQTGTGITIAQEPEGYRWYIKSPGVPTISSAWFPTCSEAKASAQMMIDAFRKGGGRGE